MFPKDGRKVTRGVIVVAEGFGGTFPGHNVLAGRSTGRIRIRGRVTLAQAARLMGPNCFAYE